MTDEFSVTVTFSKEALDYIKSFPGLMGIPKEFAKTVIEDALHKVKATFELESGGTVEFSVHTVHHVRPRWG